MKKTTLIPLRVERSRARILVEQARRLTTTTRGILEDSRKALARAKELRKYRDLAYTNRGAHMTDEPFRKLVQCLDRSSALCWETEALHARVVATVEWTRRCIANGIAVRANAKVLRKDLSS